MNESVKKYGKYWVLLLGVAYVIVTAYNLILGHPISNPVDQFGKLFLAGLGIIYILFRTRKVWN